MEKVKIRFPKGAKIHLTDDAGQATEWVFDRNTTHEFDEAVAARLIRDGIGVPGGLQQGPTVQR